jgi:hypothetical protein
MARAVLDRSSVTGIQKTQIVARASVSISIAAIAQDVRIPLRLRKSPDGSVKGSGRVGAQRVKKRVLSSFRIYATSPKVNTDCRLRSRPCKSMFWV